MVSSEKRQIFVVSLLTETLSGGSFTCVQSISIVPYYIPPLPRGKSKSALQVLADFMHYLFSCARSYITESHASGTSMWRSLENNIDFILTTHPNGWEELQQQQIRRAAEIAGLVPGDDAGRIHLHGG